MPLRVRLDQNLAVGSGQWAVGGDSPLRGVPCAARSNSSQISRRNARSAWRESVVFSALVLTAAAVICLAMPGIAGAANQQSSKSANQQIKTGTTGAEGASDRAPSVKQTPRNPRVSALRVLPEGFFIETHGALAATPVAPAEGSAFAGWGQERGPFISAGIHVLPITGQRPVPPQSRMRLLVPLAFRPARAT